MLTHIVAATATAIRTLPVSFNHFDQMPRRRSLSQIFSCSAVYKLIDEMKKCVPCGDQPQGAEGTPSNFRTMRRTTNANISLSEWYDSNANIDFSTEQSIDYFITNAPIIRRKAIRRRNKTKWSYS